MQGVRPIRIILNRKIQTRTVKNAWFREVFKEGKYSQLAEALLVDEVQIKKNTFGVVLLKIPKKSLLHDIYSSLSYSDWLNLTETVLDLVQKLKN